MRLLFEYHSVPGKYPWALDITCYLGLHGRLPGIKIPYVCIEAATVVALATFS